MSVGDHCFYVLSVSVCFVLFWFCSLLRAVSESKWFFSFDFSFIFFLFQSNRIVMGALVVCDALHTFSEYINFVDKVRIMYHRISDGNRKPHADWIVYNNNCKWTMNVERWTMDGGCYDYLPLSILLLNIKCGLYPLISSFRFNMMMMIFVVLLSSVFGIRYLAFGYMMGISNNNNERANHLWAFNEIVIIFWSNHIVLHIVINWQPAIRCTFSTHFRLIIWKNAALQ